MAKGKDHWLEGKNTKLQSFLIRCDKKLNSSLFYLRCWTGKMHEIDEPSNCITFRPIPAVRHHYLLCFNGIPWKSHPLSHILITTPGDHTALSPHTNKLLVPVPCHSSSIIKSTLIVNDTLSRTPVWWKCFMKSMEIKSNL